MKNGLLAVLILFLCTSCTYFQAEKISSEEFMEEELKSINWNEVDAYPVFEDCSERLAKDAQKKCFESTLLRHIHGQLQEKVLISTQSLNKTILMNIEVNREGRVILNETTGDSIVFAELPNLKSWLQESVHQLPKAEPAVKRGIPVSTRFILPVVIKTE